MIEEFLNANFKKHGILKTSFIVDPYNPEITRCSYCGGKLITSKKDDGSYLCECENKCKGFLKEVELLEKYFDHYEKSMILIQKEQEKLKKEEKELIEYEKAHAKVTLAKLYFSGKEKNDNDRKILEDELSEVLKNV